MPLPQHIEISSLQDKSLRFFTYLKELSALRTIQVRNVSSYDQLFWLCDLPCHKLCLSSLRRLIDPPFSGVEPHPDTWIEIHKPILKSPPELPEDVEPWIKEEEFANSSLSKPGLHEQIPRFALQSDISDTDPNALVSINEYPHVFDKWVNYVETQWKSWAAEDQELQKVQKAYNQLFNIYQRQEKLGEQYEVVFGAGLLSWKSPNSGEIKRHILAIQARIEFDRIRGIMTVCPALDGPQPILECGMLETADRPNPTDLTKIENDVLALNDDPWEIIRLESVLQGFANSLPIAGDYTPFFEHFGTPSDKPVVRLAPALILRKRTRCTFENFYQQIIEQVEKGEKIPENIHRIIEILDDLPDGQGASGNNTNENVKSSMPIDTELYFPLPANEEQKRIVQKVEHRRGVLVQGPPGTGKSHTIANLISHFLAKGKRILVTSETPRALEVLRSKLPKEIEELCVVWLGSDPESRKALEKSVIGITQRKVNWNPTREQSLIKENAQCLDDERKEQAQLRHELRACREADTYHHSNIFDRYSGTLQQIAVQISQKRDYFQWFLDRPQKATDSSIKPNELLKMAQIHRSLTADLVEQLKFQLFPIEQLRKPDEFRSLVKAEQEAKIAHKEAYDKRNYPGYAQLSSLDRKKRDTIKRIIEGILVIQDSLSKHFHSWAERACREIAGDHDRIWRQIFTQTTYQINYIEYLLNKYGFFSKPLVWIKLKRLDVLWKEITTPPTGNTSLRCSAYHDFCEPIEQALFLYDRIEEVRRICHDYPGISFPAWYSQEEVRAFMKALEALNLEEDFATVQRFFIPLAESLKDYISSKHSHASTERLLQAVNQRDGELYQDVFESLSSLHTWEKSYNFACDVHERFHNCAPETCESYDHSYTESTWDKRFAEFDAAWIWAKTDCWLNEMNDKDRVKCIQKALEDSSSRERDALKNLAAVKAWQHCMTNLREKERMSLIAWAQAVARIRSGTGKYAETRRETAKQKLDECRKAIPAWVMPLYQVVQTTRPRRHQFDIVIIDEASQSGPEALLLNYISDKLIVVGDDKQIMPMHIGVDRSAVEFLRRKHLKDIPHPEALDLEGSLFSQAELRFPDRIRLREHFRCMPEIIQFSNNLSYSTEPLIPLRQYGADRLEPLRTVFVKDGYRKGLSDDIENPPEAKAIAAKIAECCEDFAYAGKTFGVISLMGSRQAELINSLLLGEDGIGAQEMEKRRLVCGRPYDFQGDERDVIFLSMVDAPQDGQPCRMIRDADTQRRFNVATSRARDQLWLFHSATLNDLRPECLRYRLLEYCLNPAVMQPEEIGETTLAELRRMASEPSRQKPKQGEKIPGAPFDSWFEIDVFFKIVDRGYRVLPQFHVNTRYIDLVVEGLKGCLAVECDGDEAHMDRWEEDQIRQRELERCGWIFWHVRGHDFYRDQDASLVELWKTLERLKITPRHSWESERKKSEIEMTVEDQVSTSKTTAECCDSSYDDSVKDNEMREEESLSLKNKKGRLDRALEHARLRKLRPEERAPIDIQNAIVQALQKCPNHTCTLKSLTSRVLKELGVLTRGNPRLEFERRVLRNLGVMKTKNIIEEYKAKNKRIKLIKDSQCDLFDRL